MDTDNINVDIGKDRERENLSFTIIFTGINLKMPVN